MIFLGDSLILNGRDELAQKNILNFRRSKWKKNECNSFMKEHKIIQQIQQIQVILGQILPEFSS